MTTNNDATRALEERLDNICSFACDTRLSSIA